MKQTIEKRTVPARSRVQALICAGCLATSTMLAPALAFAADVEPSVSGNETIAQTNNGTGTTDITIQLKNSDKEVTGTLDPDNPDVDPIDDLGDNIAFTVPTSINFVSDAKGKLKGPSAESTFIENESAFDIHASSVAVTAQSDWKLVADAQTSDQANALDFQIGPTGDLLDASAYQSKRVVGDKTKWHMTSKRASGTDDRVLLNTQGDINNVNQDLKDRTKVATIVWYVTPGAGSSA